ncbi:MAG TPA: hypothetical protein VIJ39_09725 [Solirubrobacteraceae bacterium]
MDTSLTVGTGRVALVPSDMGPRRVALWIVVAEGPVALWSESSLTASGGDVDATVALWRGAGTVAAIELGEPASAALLEAASAWAARAPARTAALDWPESCETASGVTAGEAGVITEAAACGGAGFTLGVGAAVSGELEKGAGVEGDVGASSMAGADPGAVAEASALACAIGDGSSEADARTEADPDAGTGGDADAGTEADADAGTEADADAGTEADAHARTVEASAPVCAGGEARPEARGGAEADEPAGVLASAAASPSSVVAPDLTLRALVQARAVLITDVCATTEGLAASFPSAYCGSGVS